ncbi:Uncharacterized protein FWK35_00017199 [Aphis craccivora]|uniref:Uncharacterized protein n=1 Tax=Aphis craccivora TaxID=307492 RepID=A0A6G0YS32_APHCR|nr:Uncharacterized protein FWK35_00017199 [Aphis craccivora]
MIAKLMKNLVLNFQLLATYAKFIFILIIVLCFFYKETNLEEQKILKNMNTYTDHHKTNQNVKIKNQAEIILGVNETNSLSDQNRIQIEKN